MKWRGGNNIGNTGNSLRFLPPDLKLRTTLVCLFVVCLFVVCLFVCLCLFVFVFGLIGVGFGLGYCWRFSCGYMSCECTIENQPRK